ncbi:MAG: uncharacterized protein KVP18_001321 [Porospora cf. gigantea A]|uniref:uncharacterized protein n=1 Tax=Porospora cf. gigantea A TaxID=2853593 RepID=UPI00355A60AB|nr:MAG: hypothetical protein KVP18_001321 [Porospora cf. gigantea A]
MPRTPETSPNLVAALKARRERHVQSETGTPRKTSDPIGRVHFSDIRAFSLCRNARHADETGKRARWRVSATLEAETSQSSSVEISLGSSRVSHAVNWSDILMLDMYTTTTDVVMDVFCSAISSPSPRPPNTTKHRRQKSPVGGAMNEAEDNTPTDGLYGRVIIPLTTLLRGKEFRTGATAYFQLYLPGSERPLRKWVRPVVGFQSAGCRYTPFTLGYISLHIQVEKYVSPAWIRSLSTVPLQYWQQPSNFDPQSFEAGFLRMANALCTIPLWFRWCFHWSSIRKNRDQHQSTRYVFLLLAFHVVLLYGLLFVSVHQVPTTLGLLTFTLSLLYVGIPESSSVVRKVPESSDAKYDAIHDDEARGILVRGRRAIYLQNPLQLHDVVSGNDPMVEENTFERLGYFSHRHCGQSAPFSEFETPFGMQAVRIEDPESYYKMFPIFAEAKNSALLTQLLQNLWFLFQMLQITSHHIAAVGEKLRYALSWRDARMSVLGFLIMLGWITLASGVLQMLVMVPVWCLRGLLAVVVYTAAFGTDPEALRTSVQPYIRDMAVTMVLNNSESIFVALVAQTMWEIGEPSFGELNGPIDWQPPDADFSFPEPQRSSTLPLRTDQESSFVYVLLLRSVELLLVILAEVSMYAARLIPWSLVVVVSLAMRPVKGLLYVTYSWWIRIPDRRELEHRLIAESQQVDLGAKVPEGIDGVEEYFEVLLRKKGGRSRRSEDDARSARSEVLRHLSEDDGRSARSEVLRHLSPSRSHRGSRSEKGSRSERSDQVSISDLASAPSPSECVEESVSEQLDDGPIIVPNGPDVSLRCGWPDLCHAACCCPPKSSGDLDSAHSSEAFFYLNDNLEAITRRDSTAQPRKRDIPRRFFAECMTIPRRKGTSVSSDH